MNTLYLIRGSDGEVLSHSGARKYRFYEVYVNGVRVKKFIEGFSGCNHATGPAFDKHVLDFLELWENALRCTAMRGELKGRVKFMHGGDI